MQDIRSDVPVHVASPISFFQYQSALLTVSLLIWLPSACKHSSHPSARPEQAAAVPLGREAQLPPAALRHVLMVNWTVWPPPTLLRLAHKCIKQRIEPLICQWFSSNLPFPPALNRQFLDFHFFVLLSASTSLLLHSALVAISLLLTESPLFMSYFFFSVLSSPASFSASWRIDFFCFFNHFLFPFLAWFFSFWFTKHGIRLYRCLVATALWLKAFS